MIRRLLLKNISIGQILGYALATLAGLSIVACAVKFYGDAVTALAPSDDENAIFSDSYLVISKPVSMLNTLGTSTSFSPEEMDELRRHQSVVVLAPFVAANFNVAASVDFSGRGFSTHMFLEAIPDEFIDVLPEGWGFDPEQPDCVPVIISKDYLALYNFGFATARGLPQITTGMLSQVPLNLTLSGGGDSETLCARIVGFSSRLNTIAVPMQFMEYANNRFAPGDSPAPSRLILRVSETEGADITGFLQSRGYEISGPGNGSARATTLLRVISGIVISIGAIIAALALMILLLSLNLLIQKNRSTISTLLFLGYTPSMVARRYIALVVTLNAAVTICAIAIMLGASAWWTARLEPLGIASSSPLTAIITVIVIMVTLTAINSVTITRGIRKIF